MTLRERLEWLTRMTLLVFILASAAFLSAITAMRIAIHGREVTMPNLVGKNVSEANNMLRSRGLVLRVADRIYSEQPVNVVLRQTPPAGLLMKVSQQAHVVLSLGQRQLQTPMLEGNSLRASRVELLRQGLQVGEVSAMSMPGQSADTIVLQNPKPGAGAATPRVDVLVSEGTPTPAQRSSPRVSGSTPLWLAPRIHLAKIGQTGGFPAANDTRFERARRKNLYFPWKRTRPAPACPRWRATREAAVGPALPCGLPRCVL